MLPVSMCVPDRAHVCLGAGECAQVKTQRSGVRANACIIFPTKSLIYSWFFFPPPVNSFPSQFLTLSDFIFYFFGSLREKTIKCDSVHPGWN